MPHQVPARDQLGVSANTDWCLLVVVVVVVALANLGWQESLAAQAAEPQAVAISAAAVGHPCGVVRVLLAELMREQWPWLARVGDQGHSAGAAFPVVVVALVETQAQLEAQDSLVVVGGAMVPSPLVRVALEFLREGPRLVALVAAAAVISEQAATVQQAQAAQAATAAAVVVVVALPLALVAQAATALFSFTTRRSILMPTFAVLSSNTVSNVIVADDQTIAETVTGAVCVEYTDENPAGIGWIYDETNGTFTAPVVETDEA